jgi:polyferredoxin
MRRLLWIPWRWWRRVAQLALLVAFLWLFRRTEYSGADQLAGGENLFFRADPLAALAAMLASRQIIASFWPAAVVLGLTAVLGRFFCGWVCPLGTLLDGFHRLLRPVALRTNRLLRPSMSGRRLTAVGRGARYSLLIAVLLAALLAFPLVGFVDPLALLVRGLALWGDPMLRRGADALFAWSGGGWITDSLQPFADKHLLPFRPMVFHLAGVSAAILATVFAMEIVARRFWCRYLCPAGALISLAAWRPVVRRAPSRACKSCSDCTTTCRMGAIDPATGHSSDACILCMDCVDDCPKGVAGFRVKKVRKAPARVDLSRRSVLAGIAAGVAIPGVGALARLGSETHVPPNLLRPPGAVDEDTFLNLCIRCGECMKVCPTNALQPAIFESGLKGVFSPRIAPRFIFEQSYCEYACTLCGQVCPTGAIPRLDEQSKHDRPIGKAYFDHARCLPWAEKTPCIRCQELCPVSEKAIRILRTFTIAGEDGEALEIQQPYVERDLCVGCGMCESNCPIEGQAGIRVQRVDAADPGTEFLQTTTDRS